MKVRQDVHEVFFYYVQQEISIATLTPLISITKKLRAFTKSLRLVAL